MVTTQVFLSLLILASGCTRPDRSAGVRGNAPVIVSSALSSAVPHLIGVNHIFTIKGQFSRPAGIAVDAEGNLYVADSGRSVVHVLRRDGKLLESIGRFGWREGEFDNPTGVALDSRFRLYVADTGNNRVQKLSLLNRTFSVFAGRKQDDVETSVLLSGPQSVAADGRGYVYIADTWNHRVLKMDPLGRLQMEIGGLGWTGQQFRNPQGVAVDSKSDIYISDTGNHRIHKLDFSGSQLAIWGEAGAGSGQFQGPTGQAIDRFGNVYITDRGNRRVQIFSPEGSYLAQFGQQVLDDPIDVAVDSTLRAYVTDTAVGGINVFRVIYEEAGKTR